MNTKEDRIHPIDQASEIRFNLCGPLKNPCASIKNASACLVIQGKEHLLGWLTTDIKNYNGLLSIQTVGERCEYSDLNRTLTINLHCNYESPEEGDNVKVEIVCSILIFFFQILKQTFLGKRLLLLYYEHRYIFSLRTS